MSERFEKPLFTPVPESSPEKQEKEPVLHVIISRHGPKLSAAGEKNAKALYFEDHVRAGFEGMNISESDTGLTRLATSPVGRAIDTVEAIGEELDKTQHRSKEWARPVGSLETPYQPSTETEDERFVDDFQTIINMQAQLEPKVRNSEDIIAILDEKTREAEVRNRIDMLVLTELFKDLDKPENERNFKVPYEELADTFARRYAGFSRHTKLLEKLRVEGKEQPLDQPYIQIDVTHSFPAMTFLKKYLVFEDGAKARDLQPDEFFSKTSGVIPESGSFALDYVSGENGTETIIVTGEFKEGKKFQGAVDLELLHNLNRGYK